MDPMTRAGNWKVLLTAVVMLLFVVPAYAQPEDARVSNIFVETFILDALNDISIETGVLLSPIALYRDLSPWS